MRSLVVKILNVFARKIVGKYKPVIIGVTGSAGKSSTCKIISQVLGTKYEIRMNNSRCRTDISIPLAIIGAESGKRSISSWFNIFKRALVLIWGKSNFYPDVLILEMGVDRPDDMKKMLEVVQPNIAVFSSLGEFPAHTQFFKSGKGVAREKALLFKSLDKSDVAVLNIDDDYIKNLADNIKSKKITFGFGDSAKVKGEEIFLSDKKWRIESGKIGMSFKITYEGTTIPFRFSYALGRGQIYAALAGTAVGLHFGMNMVEISEALADYRVLPGRMNLIKGVKRSLIIDDSFNSNPSSALSALETVGKLEALRKIAVLGDMLELGDCAKEGHRKVAESIADSVDLLFCYGEDAKYFCEFAKGKKMKENQIFHFKNKGELIRKLKETVNEGDIILIKGSRAMRMEEVVKDMMLEPERAGELLVK